MYQSSFAQDKPVHPGLANIDKEAITAFARDIIAKKKPEINHQDLMFQELIYKYEPNVKYSNRERLTATFILKSSKVQKGEKISYRTINVFIDPKGDISKSDIGSGSTISENVGINPNDDISKSDISPGSKITDYERRETSQFWYFLDKYNSIVYLLSSMLWIYVLIVLYRLFHKNFIILFIASSILGILYYILAMFVQSPERLSLMATASILYALGLTIEVVAIVLSIKFIQKSKT